MKLEIAMLVGPESKAFLAGLTKQIDRLEKLGGVKAANVQAAEEVDEIEETEDEEDFAPKKTTKTATKRASSFDEDEATDEDTEDVAPVKTKKKTKKLTIDDVNDACKTRAKAGGKTGRADVLKILKKGWKTESVSDLEPEDYQDVIDAMAVETEDED